MCSAGSGRPQSPALKGSPPNPEEHWASEAACVVPSRKGPATVLCKTAWGTGDGDSRRWSPFLRGKEACGEVVAGDSVCYVGYYLLTLQPAQAVLGVSFARTSLSSSLAWRSWSWGDQGTMTGPPSHPLSQEGSLYP